MSQHTFVSNPSQLAPPPKPRRIPVGDIPGFHAVDGSYARVFAQELLAFENSEYQTSLRNEDGELISKTDNNLRYLAVVIRDKHGNRIWQEAEVAVAALRLYPQSVVDALFAAAIKANTVDVKDVDRAEGNSERIPSDSSNGISASSPTSDTPVLVS